MSLLGVAEKEILAYVDPQDLFYLQAGVDGGRGIVVHPCKGDAEGIQKGVGAGLLGKTAGRVLRTAGVYSFINIKIHVSYPFCLDWALK